MMTYMQCLEAGLALHQVAIERGVSIDTVRTWEQRTGYRFPRTSAVTLPNTRGLKQ